VSILIKVLAFLRKFVVNKKQKFGNKCNENIGLKQREFELISNGYIYSRIFLDFSNGDTLHVSDVFDSMLQYFFINIILGNYGKLNIFHFGGNKTNFT